MLSRSSADQPEFYSGGLSANVQRTVRAPLLLRTRLPRMHSSVFARPERGGGRWRRRGRGEAQRRLLRAGCSLLRLRGVEKGEVLDQITQILRHFFRKENVIGRKREVLCTCADARRRPTRRLALHLRGTGQWSGRVSEGLGGQFCSCSIQQPCLRSRTSVLPSQRWRGVDKVQKAQRMGHLHGPTGVSQPIPFSGRQRGGKIS